MGGKEKKGKKEQERGKLEEADGKENKKKGNPRVLLTGLSTGAYSQALSHYCPTWDLLPAAFQPWAGSVLIRQPGSLRLLRDHHIDAGLSGTPALHRPPASRNPSLKPLGL